MGDHRAVDLTLGFLPVYGQNGRLNADLNNDTDEANDTDTSEP